MNKNATTELIAELYDEGDMDYLFLGYIYSRVYKRLDKSISNDTKRLVVATLGIMQLLIKDGDFSLLEARGYREDVTYFPIEFDFDQLEKMLFEMILHENDGTVISLTISYQFLLTKNEIGKIPTGEYPNILGELGSSKLA